MCEVTITQQSCGAKGYYELRVAFGDLRNCQLKCPFCFTQGQMASFNHLSSLSGIDLSNVKILRFTGGKPLLKQDQIDGMIRELQKIGKIDVKNLDLIVVQTNAISAEKKSLEKFLGLELPILFEVSLKGTNIREFQYLVHKDPLSYDLAKNIMEKQFQGYANLSSLLKSRTKTAVLARLGIFHSSIEQPTFKFIYPDTKEFMFNPLNWHPSVQEILQDQIKIWGYAFEGKLLVEKIKTPADGSPGIGKRYREIIQQLKSKGLMEESKSILPKIYQGKYFYKRGNEIYWKAAKLLKVKQ